MGVVFSCLASVCLWTGELLENLFLVVGEVGSILVRGIFSLLVGLCDVLAAASCCCNVPWSERPSRQHYTYGTLSHNVGGRRALHSLSGEGKAIKKQEKEAAKQEDALRIGAAKLQRAEAAAAKKAQVAEKKAAAVEPASVEVAASNASTELKPDEVARPTSSQIKAAKKAEAAAVKAAKKQEAAAAKLAAKQAKLASSTAPAAEAPAAEETVAAEPVAADKPAAAASSGWFSGLFGSAAAPAPATKAE